MDDTLSREEEVFDGARRLAESSAREAFLDRECRGDSGLRARVESLLSVHASADEMFAECMTALRNSADTPEFPPGRDFAEGIEEEQPGARIGQYKIAQKIGE